MTINRDRINRCTGLIRTVAITLMMPVMHQIVKLMGKSHGYRKQPTESVVQRLPFEVRVMNEVVRYPVDITRDADGIDESQNQHDPQGGMRKSEKERNEIPRVTYSAKHVKRVILCV